MNKEIYLLKPTFDEQTKKELLEVLDSGWVGFGPKTLEFEKKFAEYVGAKYAIATNSATSALDLCLKVYGIKGGELITPAFTFVSDAIVGEWNDMEVTFADINPRTFCIDPDSLVLSENTKAIIAVDCHGRLADIEGIRKKIEEFNVAGELRGEERINPLIIEDAAHAMYTPGVGKGDIVVYSFQAVKSLPIFDGGMITTNDEEIYKKLRPMTWLGVEKLTYERVNGGKYSWDYDIRDGNGIKAYMTDVQAVLGIGQLRRLEKTNERRREIQSVYNKAFEDYDWFTKPEYTHTVQYYTPEWRDRDGLSQFLSEKGIHTSVHFKPLSEFTYWKKAVKTPLTKQDNMWVNLLSLPVHNDLSDEDVEYVISKVKEFYE
jgi:dTDP-4-amino-4,6-dideoxygalactose transaminase